MSASLIISIISLVIAGWALIYTRRADQRHAEAMERDRKRFEAEVAATERANRAMLVITRLSYSGGPTHDRRQFEFAIQNAGPSLARGISLYLMDAAGNKVSSDAEWPVLNPGAPAESRGVSTYAVLQPPTTVWVEWQDDSGPNRRSDMGVE